MPVSPSQLQAGIEPGSTEYGSRQTLEQGLGSLGGVAPGPGQPSTGLSGAPPPPGGSPLDAMLSGRISPTGGLPPTDGLSVGPGFTPSSQRAPSATEQRLRLLMSNASSPFIRVQAERALRKYFRARRTATRF